MNRRSFLTAFGGFAASPLVAQAQQQPALPVIGFLSSGSPRAFAELTRSYHEGLDSEGFRHGRDVWIEFRWAEGHYEELPSMAADLVRRGVAMIVATGGIVTAQAAKKATATIPIVFVVGFDPVKLSLVSSLSKPGGNATGVSIFTTELAIKRLELMHDLLPALDTVALLVNPGSITTDIEIADTRAAAQTLGLKLVIVEAASEIDFQAAFESVGQQKAGAVLVSADAFFTSRRVQLVALAARFAVPTMYPLSAYARAGGLVSYGTEITWAYHQAGVYAGRILKGAKPSELPVMLPTNFNFVLNLKTAKELGITVSPMVLARAHAVLE